METGTAGADTTIKERLGAGGILYGTFAQFGAAAVVDALGAAGFDFVVVDTEHGPLGRESMAALVRAAQGAGLSALVRTSTEEIGQALDAGADGVLVPRIASLAEARAAVAATRYAPDGTRGACIGVRAQRYGAIPWASHAASANERTLVVLALEGPEVLDLAPEIIAIPGVDVVFVGAFDLSQALGHPGQPMHPAVTEALTTMVGRAAATGCAIGTWAPSAADAATRREAGVRFLTIASDALLFYHAAAACVRDLQGVPSIGAS